MSHFPHNPYGFDGLTFSPIPSAWPANTPLLVDYDNARHCFEGAVHPQVDIPGRVIEFRIVASDFLSNPCVPWGVTPRVATIPGLPRGTYQLERLLCPDLVIPGEPACHEYATQTIFIGGGDPMPVPALSLASAALAATLIVATALLRR